MTQSALSDRSVAGTPSGVPGGPPQPARRGSRMMQSRVVGALFLAGFLVYGTGSSIIASLVGSPDLLSRIAPAASLLTLGAFLILLNTAIDIAKAVLLFPIVKPHGERTALTYLAAMIVEVVFLDIGALAVVMIVPLAHHAGGPGVTTLGSLLAQTNGMAYQIGEMTLGVGATALCALLFRTRLVPRWIAVSGLIGYPSLVAGTIAELFGVHIGFALTMPGFFFELALPLWLFIKGFQPAAFQGRAVADS